MKCIRLTEATVYRKDRDEFYRFYDGLVTETRRNICHVFRCKYPTSLNVVFERLN